MKYDKIIDCNDVDEIWWNMMKYDWTGRNTDHSSVFSNLLGQLRNYWKYQTNDGLAWMRSETWEPTRESAWRLLQEDVQGLHHHAGMVGIRVQTLCSGKLLREVDGGGTWSKTKSVFRFINLIVMIMMTMIKTIMMMMAREICHYRYNLVDWVDSYTRCRSQCHDCKCRPDKSSGSSYHIHCRTDLLGTLKYCQFHWRRKRTFCVVVACVVFVAIFVLSSVFVHYCRSIYCCLSVLGYFMTSMKRQFSPENVRKKREKK